MQKPVHLCRSVRTPAQAIINAISADPVITSGHSCGSGSVTLEAISSDPVTWYDQASGGQCLVQVRYSKHLYFLQPPITMQLQEPIVQVIRCRLKQQFIRYLL